MDRITPGISIRQIQMWSLSAQKRPKSLGLPKYYMRFCSKRDLYSTCKNNWERFGEISHLRQIAKWYCLTSTACQSSTWIQFSPSVVSISLQPHGLQHIRLPCPSPTPRVYSNSCPKSFICYSDPLGHMFTSILFYKNQGTGKLMKLLWVHQLEGGGLGLRLGQFGFQTYSWPVMLYCLWSPWENLRIENGQWKNADKEVMLLVSWLCLGEGAWPFPHPPIHLKGLPGLKDEGPLHQD